MREIVLAAALALSASAVPLGPTTAPHTSAAADAEWSVDLSTVDGDDVAVEATASDGLRLAKNNVRAASADAPERHGMLVAAPHDLGRPSDLVTAEVDADLPPGTEVLVDVRGRRADRTWSEWTPAGARLAEPTTVVQARIVLTGADGTTSPHVRAITLTASPTTNGPSRDDAPLQARVFATREGLVGRTTANGHVIVERDHFVALPSRRGLSAKDDGEYTAQVCATDGRCAWAPVWDVGPWNTKDDYWNPAGVRQMWTDLPRGTPQAQAANQNGYNGGLDQYGRQVRNPAGIDLADGTFWDALDLTTNAWVTVRYLWTGTGGRTGTVVAEGLALDVRDGPNTTHPPVGMAGNHARVLVECQVAGEQVTGTQGSSDRWLRIAADRFVPRAFVAIDDPVPDCS